MIRPTSIAWFERFYLGSVLVGAINSAMTWAETANSAEAAQAAAMLGVWFLPLSFVFIYTLWLLLWYFTARAGSAIAKWAVVVLYGCALIGFGLTFLAVPLAASVSMALTVVSLVLTGIAMWFLFRPDAAPWFRHGK